MTVPQLLNSIDWQNSGLESHEVCRIYKDYYFMARQDGQSKRRAQALAMADTQKMVDEVKAGLWPKRF